jgi:hypothetical protein
MVTWWTHNLRYENEIKKKISKEGPSKKNQSLIKKKHKKKTSSQLYQSTLKIIKYKEKWKNNKTQG